MVEVSESWLCFASTAVTSPREEGLAHMERIVSFLETADRFHGPTALVVRNATGKTFRDRDGGDLVENRFPDADYACRTHRRLPQLQDGIDAL